MGEPRDDDPEAQDSDRVNDHPEVAGADERDSDIDPAQARQELDANPGRSKRETLDIIRRGLLRDTRFSALVPVLSSKVSASFDAAGLTQDGGAPGLVGHFLVSLQSYMDAVGADVLMNALSFVNSVQVTLEPVFPSSILEHAEELAAEQPDAHLQAADLRTLIPTPVAATHVAVHFLGREDPGRALSEVRSYGAAAADHYVTLARYVAKQKGELTLRTDLEEARLPPTRAERIVTASRRPRPLEPLELTIVGRLTRTDSDDEEFRVVLDRDRIPPEIDIRKRHIEGPYTEDARRQVEAGGLWNQVVVANVLGHQVRVPTRTKPVIGRFEFVALRRAAG